jgi:hypothetical protein
MIEHRDYWGNPNRERQPTIAPSDGPKTGIERKEWEQRGQTLPARPCWLCITAPEYSPRPQSGAEDWTEGQIVAQEERERIRKEKAIAAELKYQKQLEEKRKKRKVITDAQKKYREERAKKNKGKGFARGKKGAGEYHYAIVEVAGD